MFKDVGSKLKGTAVILFIVGLLITLPIAVITIFIAFVAENGMVILYGCIMLLCQPIVSLISAWILYAFGQLVEDVEAIRIQTANVDNVTNIDRNIRSIEQLLANEKKKTVEQKETTAVSEESKKEEKARSDTPAQNVIVGDSTWICGKCHSKNLMANPTCWSCHTQR